MYWPTTYSNVWCVDHNIVLFYVMFQSSFPKIILVYILPRRMLCAPFLSFFFNSRTEELETALSHMTEEKGAIILTLNDMETNGKMLRKDYQILLDRDRKVYIYIFK